jgi:CDP-diacylglycerol--serine O-phosphatidyltransferase
MSLPVRHARISAADVLTLGNGVCGFLALAVLAQVWIAEPDEVLGRRELVACLLLYGIGMLCDVLDGPLARWLGSSGLGSVLDTICDTVTFGLLPAMLLVARVHEDAGWTAPALAVACAYVGATMLRLARQAWLEQTRAAALQRGAVATGQPEFTGMPSPVGGNCVLAVAVLAPPPVVSLAVVALVAALLVANFPYPTNKTVVGGGFVAVLLAASFAALAGLISLDVPSAIALVGLLPIAVMRAARSLLHGR